MAIQRYFRESIESVIGEAGFGYYEFADEFCTRQIKVFNDRVERFSQTKGNPDINMTDQPLTDKSFSQSDEISQNEFEEVWSKARK